MSKSGFINLLKPPHISSNGVTVCIRGAIKSIYGEKVKVGHCGTLDPAGMGVLPIAVGKATKLFDHLLQFDKCYRAEFVFGSTTDTLDSYGQVTQSGLISDFTQDEIQKVIPRLTGKVIQTPPSYSAKSVNGVKAYELARRGIEVDLVGKEVQISYINFVRKTDAGYVFDIKCSSGTYIRSICRDMASELGTVGYMSWIVRTFCHGFDISDSVDMQSVLSAPYDHVIPIAEYLKDHPTFKVDIEYSKAILNGAVFDIDIEDGTYLGYLGDKLVGLYSVLSGKATQEVWLYDN